MRNPVRQARSACKSHNGADKMFAQTASNAKEKALARLICSRCPLLEECIEFHAQNPNQRPVAGGSVAGLTSYELQSWQFIEHVPVRAIAKAIRNSVRNDITPDHIGIRKKRM